MATGTEIGGKDLPAGGAVFYRFRDATGRIHIVDSLDLVPPRDRAHVERIAYSEEPSGSVLSQLPSLPGWQSVALGLSLGVGLLLLFSFQFPRLRGAVWVLVRTAGFAGLALLLIYGYLGWMRRSTGATGAALASPSAVIQDAKSAVEKMNAHVRAQEAELKAIEQAK